MTEEVATTKEIAKAVQETGKAVQGVTELVGNVGSWMSRVMGTVPEDVVALVAGDRLRALRLRKQLEHLDSIRRKQEEIIRRRGIADPKPIGLKQAIPAFEAMADESDETLQDLWARLLANAMDPDRDVHLQTIFVDTLRQFVPNDAVVFHALYGTSSKQERKLTSLRQRLDLRESAIQLSIDRLKQLGCLLELSNYEKMIASPLGLELWYAIKDNDTS